MSQLMPDDATAARRRYRNGYGGEASQAEQQAGLAALISIAQRIDQGGKGAPEHGWAAVGAPRHPAWLVEHPRVSVGGPQRGRDVARRIDTGALVLQVKRLSRGTVAKVSHYGPVISREARPQRRLTKSTFSNMLSPGTRALIAILSLCWALCLADFWVWWLEPSHRISTFGIVLNSIVLFYLTRYPIFYVVAANRLRNVSRSVRVPRLRVAFIVTRAPSEPWDVARATLIAMINQEFPLPYDVWLADESPTREILQWCFANGVIVSSRQGVEGYHRPSWPRRTKCKEGNLAYFYDHWGYRSYDVVAQLDCDHRPSPTYLASMVRPFADPAIGYVAAPSVCDTNARRVLGSPRAVVPGGHVPRGVSARPQRGLGPGLHRLALRGADRRTPRHRRGWPGARRGLLDQLPAHLRGMAWRVRHRRRGAWRWAGYLRRHARPGIPVV